VYAWIKKWLFRLDPEKAHEWTVKGLETVQHSSALLWLMRQAYDWKDPRLAVSCCQMNFDNPVGLAAGFDKHARVYPALAALGFGFVEVGTLTPRPQPGNPHPRLYRLPEDEALINRMGFNNSGVIQAGVHFSNLPRPNIPIGVNLGKNKHTPQEQAAADYRMGLRALYRHGDYFVVNVSSPNTAGLRDLQHAEALYRLLSDVLGEREVMREETGEVRPVFLKVAPDLTDEQLNEIVQIGLGLGIDGLIAVNTTLARDGLKSAHQQETGGLSGRPLRERAIEVIRHLYRSTEGRVPIIGVGGIFTGEDAYAKIRAGATLVQVYTGMIYRGPGIVKWINRELIRLMERDGLHSIQEAVGLDT
jgi:dihydroorotate dehydrogenase